MQRLFAILLLALPAPAVQYTTDSPWIWPLSGDLYTPRKLLHTHGQPQFVTTGTLLHQGIDILAEWDEVVWGVGDFGAGPVLLTTTELEVVRASFDGVVRFVKYTEGDWGNYVVVSPTSTSDWGLQYVHLESVWVSEGEEVFRGESLGRIALEPDDPDLTHLHLALVECPESEGCEFPPELGNPLPWISSRPDHTAPTFDDIGPLGSSSTSARIVFLDKYHEPLVPTSGLYPTLSGSVKILVRVSDRFETASSPTDLTNVPLRIRVNVRRLLLVIVGYPMPTPSDLHVPVAYSNTIEFLDPISDADASNPKCFRSGTGEFDSTDGDFYVLATDGITDEGVWDTELTSDGVYAVEVSAEDVGGNLSTVTALVWVNN